MYRQVELGFCCATKVGDEPKGVASRKRSGSRTALNAESEPMKFYFDERVGLCMSINDGKSRRIRQRLLFCEPAGY